MAFFSHEQCAYTPPKTFQMGAREVMGGLAKIERDQELQRLRENDAMEFEIKMAQRKLEFVQRRRALLDCVEKPVLIEPLVFKIGRSPDGTTVITIDSPAGTVIQEKLLSNDGKFFLARFTVPGRGTYTWKIDRQELIRRRKRSETITVAPPKNAAQQQAVIEELSALLACREIFYHAQLDQACMQKDGRPQQERIARFETAKAELDPYRESAIAAEIERKLNEEIIRVRNQQQPGKARIAPPLAQNPPRVEPLPPARKEAQAEAPAPVVPPPAVVAPPPRPRETRENREEPPLHPDFFRGITYASVGSPQVSYEPKKIRGDLEHLREMGVNTLVLITHMEQTSNSSTDVRIAPRYPGAPTMEELRVLVPLAKRMGFKVVFKVHLTVHEKSYLGFGKAWCGYIPGSAKWFQKYREELLRYARLAQETGVDLLVIGNEMKESEEQTARWRETIRQVRGAYSGLLTYAGYAKTFDENVRFYGDLDFVGVNAWPTQDLMRALRGNIPTDEAKMTEREKRRYQDKMLKPYLNRMVRVARKVGKPVIFTEFGCRATDDALKKPSSHADYKSDTPSARAQQFFYECLFELLAQEPYRTWIRGGFVWNWAPGLSSEKVARTYRGYAVDFPPKPPAQEVIRQYYRIPGEPPRFAQR